MAPGDGGKLGRRTRLKGLVWLRLIIISNFIVIVLTLEMILQNDRAFDLFRIIGRALLIFRSGFPPDCFSTLRLRRIERKMTSVLTPHTAGD